MYLAIRRTIGRKLCCWKVVSCAGRIAVFRTWWNDLLTTPDIHKFVLKRCHVSSAAIAFAFVVLKKMRHCPSLFTYLDYSIDRRLRLYTEVALWCFNSVSLIVRFCVKFTFKHSHWCSLRFFIASIGIGALTCTARGNAACCTQGPKVGLRAGDQFDSVDSNSRGQQRATNRNWNTTTHPATNRWGMIIIEPSRASTSMM